MRYWYCVILGTIGIGIVKDFSKYWYWYWVLLRAVQSIGIGKCQDPSIILVLGIVKASLEILGIDSGVLLRSGANLTS